MNDENIIYALGVHKGGGLIILKEFLKRKKNYFYYFDSRLNPIHYRHIKHYKVIKKNLIGLLKLYSNIPKKTKNIIFINGLPPFLSLKKNIFVLFQNLNIFPPKKILNLLLWFFSFDFLRYINFKLGSKNVLTWYVLSDVAKTVLEKNLEKYDKIVKLMFFNLNQNINKKIKKYDFIYPADLKRHKNHKKVIMALLDLEKQNIKPSFLFTLTNAEKKKLKFDQLKTKINIYNFEKHNDRSSFLDLLKKSDCLFFPSHDETIGLPILEAFNQNLIIATANKPYAKQFIIPDFTFSPDSVHSIKQTIKKIYFMKKNNTTNTYKKNKKVKLSYFLQKEQFFKDIMK